MFPDWHSLKPRVSGGESAWYRWVAVAYKETWSWHHLQSIVTHCTALGMSAIIDNFIQIRSQWAPNTVGSPCISEQTSEMLKSVPTLDILQHTGFPQIYRQKDDRRTMEHVSLGGGHNHQTTRFKPGFLTKYIHAQDISPVLYH